MRKAHFYHTEIHSRFGVRYRRVNVPRRDKMRISSFSYVLIPTVNLHRTGDRRNMYWARRGVAEGRSGAQKSAEISSLCKKTH